jgi:2-enoate reductase
MNGMDGVEGGITPEESARVAKDLETAGVDYIHVSAGMGHLPHLVQQSIHLEQGCLVSYAEGVKREVKTPVIAVGSLTSPLMAAGVLRDGKADLIAMGRPLIADPDLPMKAKAGELDHIRTCIRCNVCISRLYESRELACALNPEVGREGLYSLNPVAKPKKVVVVGGGPAGMETARVSALRGHAVILFEKSDRLGGASLPKDNPPFKKELESIPRYYSEVLKSLNVQVNLKQEANAAAVEKINPDVAVLAVGGRTVMPDVPGIEHPHVILALDLLNARADAGSTVLVVGSGLVGCETALFLASKGKNVTLATRRGRMDVAADMNMVNRQALIEEIGKAHVAVVENYELHSIVKKGAVLVDREWKKLTIEADTVVIARGIESDRKLYGQMEQKGYEVYAIGDCSKPGDIESAVRDGYHLGRRL